MWLFCIQSLQEIIQVYEYCFFLSSILLIPWYDPWIWEWARTLSLGGLQDGDVFRYLKDRNGAYSLAKSDSFPSKLTSFVPFNVNLVSDSNIQVLDNSIQLKRPTIWWKNNEAKNRLQWRLNCQLQLWRKKLQFQRMIIQSRMMTKQEIEGPTKKCQCSKALPGR